MTSGMRSDGSEMRSVREFVDGTQAKADQAARGTAGAVAYGVLSAALFELVRKKRR